MEISAVSSMDLTVNRFIAVAAAVGRPTAVNGRGGGAVDRVVVEREAESTSSDRSSSSRAPASPQGKSELTGEDQRELDRMRGRDQEVRAHEQAHIAAAGAFAKGGAKFSYTTGPDGKRYARAGSVEVDLSPVPGDPQATVQKMQTIRRAALAPADPSGADRQVAARAAALEQKARKTLARSNGDALQTAEVAPNSADPFTAAHNVDEANNPASPRDSNVAESLSPAAASPALARFSSNMPADAGSAPGRFIDVTV